MRIAILGIGAMGCLFGAKLARRADVILLGRWPEQIATLNRQPLRVQQSGGGVDEVQLQASDTTRGIPPVDVALLLTKSSKTRLAARDAVRVLRPDGLAVTLQNGLGNFEILAGLAGHQRATLGVTAQGATLVEPGVVRHSGGGPTHLATRPAIAERVQTLTALFQAAGLPITVSADINGVVWGKLAVNAAINPLTALLRMPNGSLLVSETARTLLGQTAREVQAVAAAQGITLPFPDAAQQAATVARQTASNRSSMLQDVLRGAQTEIEHINGAVVRYGAEYDVPTPANAMLYRLVKALDEMASSR